MWVKLAQVAISFSHFSQCLNDLDAQAVLKLFLAFGEGQKKFVQLFFYFVASIYYDSSKKLDCFTRTKNIFLHLKHVLTF